MTWNREDTLSLLQTAIAHSPADETEAIFSAQDYGLTRFAGSVIHQNMSERDAILSVRVARGQRLGAYATNRLDLPGIKAAVEQATRYLSLAAEPLQPVSVRGKAESVKIYAIISDFQEKV